MSWKDPQAATDLAVKLERHLQRIAMLFKPGAKLTLVVRLPSIPSGDADVVIGDDDYDDAIAAINRLRTRPEVPR